MAGRNVGSCHFSCFSNSIEPEREIVMIIAENDKVQAICSRIETDLQLDQPGKGILLVTPLPVKGFFWSLL